MVSKECCRTTPSCSADRPPGASGRLASASRRSWSWPAGAVSAGVTRSVIPTSLTHGDRPTTLQRRVGVGGPKQGGLGQAPDELHRAEGVVEVGEGSRREAVAVVRKRAFFELVAHDGGDPGVFEHDARLPNRAAHDLQRRPPLRRRFGVDEIGELGRDASGGRVNGASETFVDSGAGVGGETVPGVEDPSDATEEILGEVRLDAGDDGRAGFGGGAIC